VEWPFKFVRDKTEEIRDLLVVFLLLTMPLILVSGTFQFSDISSDSWLDRLKGDGWQFQRGAALVKRDQFGHHFSTVRYVSQGWKPADSMWFYNTTQGSDLLPYDFFLALEKPGTSELFCSNDNLNY